MKQLGRLILHDFKSTFRDPIFRIILLFPFFSFFLIKWGLPSALVAYPVLEDYKDLIIMWACLQSATLFGFIYGFLFLEEKEDGILPVLRVLPVPTSYLVGMRQLLGIIISSFVNFIILQYTDILELGFLNNLSIAFQMSLMAPLLMLLLTVFAKNRMEGMAQMKIFNLALIAPGLIYILPYKALHALAIVPTYWSFRSIEFAQSTNFNWPLVIGFLAYAIVLYILNRRFKKAVLD